MKLPRWMLATSIDSANADVALSLPADAGAAGEKESDPSNPAHPVSDRHGLRIARWSCVGLGVLFLIIAWVSMGTSTTYPGDELRFIESSKAFAGMPTIELLRTYEEMSGPLPFWYWGNWGQVFGYDLASMRLGTMVWGVLTLWLLFEVLATLLPRPRWVVVAFACVVLNPYWWTMSVFAYTDIFGVAGLLLASLGVTRGRPWWRAMSVAFGVAIALLSRQYLVFALPAMGAVALSWWGVDRKAAVRLLVALIAGCLPMAGLVLLWRGLGPDNVLKATYATGLLRWKLESAWLYVSLMGIYGLPLWIWLRHAAVFHRWEWLLAAAAMVAGGCIVLSPSESAVIVGYTTVGLFDRTIQWVGMTASVRHVLWTLGGVLGVMLLGRLTYRTWRDLRQNRFGADGYILLILLGVLIVMPLSYLHWEKYFIPALPWLCAGIVRLRMTATTRLPA